MNQNTIMRLLVFFSLIFLFSSFTQELNTTGKERQAVVAAKEWLVKLDNKKYVETWNEAGDLLKNVVTKEEWEKSISAPREMLGSVEKRIVKSTEYKTELAGAPDGEYVVIEFETSFQNKKSAIETVTPYKGKDEEWRVVGYYIR